MDRRHYLAGLIGSGVGPSLTPALHMTEAEALGLAYVYRTIDLATLGLSSDSIGELVRAARTFGFDVLNITHPCKQRVIEHLDRLDERAEAIGAVNTVIFDGAEAVGYNTDTTGFATALRTGLPDAPMRRVVLLGAGGAGAAVSDALLHSGVQQLDVVDLDERRAAALAQELAPRFPDAQVGFDHPDKLSVLVPEGDGLVHCTPTGMAHHPGIPLDAELLHPDLWVADIVYRPLETPLLRAAHAAGCRTLNGGQMAVHQAVDTLRLVTGLEPDVPRMLRHFTCLAQADNP